MCLGRRSLSWLRNRSWLANRRSLTPASNSNAGQTVTAWKLSYVPPHCMVQLTEQIQLAAPSRNRGCSPDRQAGSSLHRMPSYPVVASVLICL